MLHIEEYTLNGEYSTALVYKNDDLESYEVQFSANELHDYVELNGLNINTVDVYSMESHDQHLIELSFEDTINSSIVLDFLKTKK